MSFQVGYNFLGQFSMQDIVTGPSENYQISYIPINICLLILQQKKITAKTMI